MKTTIAILLLAAGTLISGGKPQISHYNTYATCRGENPCKACKNCKYCKRCAKNGLTCGVCKK